MHESVPGRSGTDAKRRKALRPLFLGLLGVAEHAGPPFRTDDPRPVDPAHLELYLFAAGQRAAAGSTGVGPAVEFNYGILPDVQFHAIVPYAYNRPQDAPARAGLGNTEAGSKVRFIHETATLPQVGIFPLVEISTGRGGRASAQATPR